MAYYFLLLGFLGFYHIYYHEAPKKHIPSIQGLFNSLVMAEDLGSVMPKGPVRPKGWDKLLQRTTILK